MYVPNPFDAVLQHPDGKISKHRGTVGAEVRALDSCCVAGDRSPDTLA